MWVRNENIRPQSTELSFHGWSYSILQILHTLFVAATAGVRILSTLSLPLPVDIQHCLPCQPGMGDRLKAFQ